MRGSESPLFFIAISDVYILRAIHDVLYLYTYSTKRLEGWLGNAQRKKLGSYYLRLLIFKYLIAVGIFVHALQGVLIFNYPRWVGSDWIGSGYIGYNIISLDI
jgi:hypothetical protein